MTGGQNYLASSDGSLKEILDVDIDSSTITADFGGKFKEELTKREFLEYISMRTKFDA